MQQPGFLQTFIGSLTAPQKYGEYSKRSAASMFGHYVLVVTLCCCFYALASTMWLNKNVSPYLDELVQEVPSVSITDGKATVDIEQPHYFKIEDEVIAVIDTTKDPKEYLEEYKEIVVFGEERMITRDRSGEVNEMTYDADFSFDSTAAQGWLETAESWFLPSLFVLCMLWQFCWKIVQVLIVATIVTLVQSSKPSFGVHFKLAILALGPAMAFGVFNYLGTIFAFGFPGAGLIFWAILGGLTYLGSEQLKKTAEYS